MDLKGFGPQFSELGLATKMVLQVDYSNFFHLENTEIEKNYIMIQYGSYSHIQRGFWSPNSLLNEVRKIVLYLSLWITILLFMEVFLPTHFAKGRVAPIF
jgi:hypothetical protein